jgi:hypothetical protein
METALAIILPVITAGITIASFFIARAAEARKRGSLEGSLRADIAYIKEKVTELCHEQEVTNMTLCDHFERIIRLEENVKTINKRLGEFPHDEKNNKI